MMNDESEQFEQRLSRQPLRQVPREWRAEIVGQVSSLSAAVLKKKPETGKMPVPLFLRELFWPHPKAWAALAAVWIFIFILNFSTRDKSPVVAEKIAPPSPEMVAELRQQKLLFAELIGSSDVREAEQPKFFPRPRTERAEILTA